MNLAYRGPGGSGEECHIYKSKIDYKSILLKNNFFDIFRIYVYEFYFKNANTVKIFNKNNTT